MLDKAVGFARTRSPAGRQFDLEPDYTPGARRPRKTAFSKTHSRALLPPFFAQ